MKYKKIAYLCDGTACAKMCANLSEEERANHRCKHTLDETHAKNKCRRKRKIRVYKDGSAYEVE